MSKLLYFSAPWCGPCRMLGPTMEQAAQELPVQKVLVDDEPDLATQYGIRNIPTIIKVDDNGVEQKRIMGLQTLDQIKEFYNGN